ncbi:phenazine biosynthesis-like domain-containing protein [Homarus americanus]|uniref:phenazine biosynthesis-like domain-containing protein n=1 Tax=Homarus americanus TaxID=6706 RepID=UPI001C46D315|nr:phenazine biosynthesis-like domain-containing protein [Homarus americanus]
MKVSIFTVDAFTDHPFSGNPAAVVPLLQPLQEELMQKLAGEMNLSETAYVSPVGEEAAKEEPWVRCSRFSLRWFSPTTEVPLCGHATLATAHVLFNELGNCRTHVEFETLSGVLVARKDSDNIVLDFPANTPVPLTPHQDTQLGPLLRVATDGLQVQQMMLSHTTKKLLVRLHHSCTRKHLENLRIDSGSFLNLHDGSLVKGIIYTLHGGLHVSNAQITAPDSPQYHCLSRYFAPWNGIPEDPVTGSTHTVLGPYWSKELGITTLKCRQCSPRGGDLLVTVRGDGRVDLAGRATTIIQGYLTLTPPIKSG